MRPLGNNEIPIPADQDPEYQKGYLRGVAATSYAINNALVIQIKNGADLETILEQAKVMVDWSSKAVPQQMRDELDDLAREQGYDVD